MMTRPMMVGRSAEAVTLRQPAYCAPKVIKRIAKTASWHGLCECNRWDNGPERHDGRMGKIFKIRHR